MRAKNIVDLLTLSVSLYMLSKDEEFLKDAAELTAKGKQKATELFDTVTNIEGEEIIGQIREHASKIKDEMITRANEIAINVYNKMHIAHTDDIKKISDELSVMKTELALAEARIVNLESRFN